MSELERELTKRLRAREERAFRELIALHRDRVYNITYRMLGNRAEAEDVAQEVFITVFKTIETSVRFASSSPRTATASTT